MLRLAMLLVGARALRRKWLMLGVLGLLWMALGLAIMADASGRLGIVTVEAIAVLLLFEGFLALALFTLAPHRRGYTVLVKALALLVLGCMILDFPVRVDIEDSLLFGLAFLIDGGGRIATASVVRFPKWQVIAAGGVLELCLGGLTLIEWPAGYDRTVPFCIGVALLLSGWTILRIGLRLHQLTDDTPVVSLPVFEHRGWQDLGSGWQDLGPALPRARPTAPARHVTPLLVHVWTPVGSAASPRSKHRLLIDRYIAAVDGKGMISTGHAALELAPDIYISHYPALDLDHSPEEFAHLLRATPDNNVKGHFQPPNRRTGARPIRLSSSTPTTPPGCARIGRPTGPTTPTISPTATARSPWPWRSRRRSRAHSASTRHGGASGSCCSIPISGWRPCCGRGLNR
jgi:uncharacterized membrane protein HdeD (DUF308 family)